MKEADALRQMVSPGMRRPSVGWRNGVLQIWITRGCDLSCFGCTQASNLGGKPGRITLDQFEQAVKSLEGYFGVVGIFGGNPALHPQFNEMCEILRAHFPREQCGLWCNHPRGKMEAIKQTFNPATSNINVHLVREAYDEFVTGWPELIPYMKGLDPSWPEAEAFRGKEYEHRVGDARHSPPYIAMQDLDQLPFPDGSVRPNTEENRWELIAGCDINKQWSAMICVFRDQLRGFFCEIAGARRCCTSTSLSTLTRAWRSPQAGGVDRCRTSPPRPGYTAMRAVSLSAVMGNWLSAVRRRRSVSRIRMSSSPNRAAERSSWFNWRPRSPTGSGK